VPADLVSVELALIYGLAAGNLALASETTTHRKHQIEPMHSFAKTAIGEKLHHSQEI